MIVRIATEEQYKLPDDVRQRLNELDNEAVAAVEAGDEPRFHELFEKMLHTVRTEGHLLDDGELRGSDVILPPPDTSFEEAKADFTGEGLIPEAP